MEVIKKINNLTDGIYAKKYFTQNGLDYNDAVNIRENLIKEAQNNKISIIDVELQIQSRINSLRYNKKITDAEEKILKNKEEKLLTFKYNNEYRDIKCSKCENILLPGFKYCPKCGNEIKVKKMHIITKEEIDFSKGYVTPQELKYMKLITEEEGKLLKENKVTYEDIGIQIDETNCPIEIRNEIISKNRFLRDNLDARKELFDKNIQIHKSQFENTYLSYLNDEELGKEKLFPISNTESEDTQKQRKPTRHIIKETSETEVIKIDLTEGRSKRKITPIKDLPLKERYACVLYLKDVIKHPQNPKVPEYVLYTLNIPSTSEFITHLKDNNYVTLAEGTDLIKINLRALKVVDLKKILSENNQKVSGRKDQLIERICENISEDKLKNYSKGKSWIVTRDGMNFLERYPQVEIYSKYLRKYHLGEYEHYYEEHHGHSLTDIALGYLEHMRKIYADKMKWYQFKLTYETEFRINRDNKDKYSALVSYINYFICHLNPWIDNCVYTNYTDLISKNLKAEVTKVIDMSEILENKIHEIFITESATIDLPHLFLTAEEMYNYFMRIYNEDDLDMMNKELFERFKFNKVSYDEMKFYTKKEQEEKYLKAKKLAD